MEKSKELKALLLILTLLIYVFVCILSVNIIDIGKNNKSEAAVLDTSRADFLTKDLLLADRTSSGRVVFDGNALSELYTKLAGTGADYANVESIAKRNGTNTSLSYAPTGKNSGEIRNSNAGKDIVVVIGGLEWIVTMLTTDKNGDPILTLWLRDTNDRVNGMKIIQVMIIRQICILLAIFDRICLTAWILMVEKSNTSQMPAILFLLVLITTTTMIICLTFLQKTT